MTTLDQLSAGLRGAPALLEAELRATLFKGAMKIKESANRRAPEPVGATVEFDIDVTPQGVAAVIETKSEFGAIFEFGTPSLPGGRPFIEPSVEDELPALDKFIFAAGDKALP